MSFDKNKAMRNAERFLSQGKIRAAINEYQRVVENDPKDFSTLNILGDLYAKNLDRQQAIGCFTLVAEHYNKQGFSHKAIAVYNKISRIEPSSIEVSAKLAELYQSKGSIAEARRHYKTLAEHYQKKGQKIESLAIWKQIAELDQNNTEIYLKIAEACRQEEQFEEAARAFTEAGLRFIKHDKFESALASFSRALDIKKDDLRALKGLVKSQIGLGCADEAANTLEEVLKEQPHNRDVLYLLVDCYLDMDSAQQAEGAVMRLVEQEPANYLKFLDLVKLYLKGGDLGSATRLLSMSAEHLLVAGQAEEFFEWTNEVLARNPEQVDALRLLVRYYSWQRDEAALKQSLERLAEAARLSGSVEDEHYALSQIVMMAPYENEHAQRLQELGTTYGLQTEFPPNQAIVAESNDQEIDGDSGYEAELDFTEASGSDDFETNGASVNGAASAMKDFAFYDNDQATIVEEVFETHSQKSFEPSDDQAANGHNLASDLRLQKELDSIEFYIEQGYRDLAVKALDELEAEFGQRAEINKFRSQLGITETILNVAAEPEKTPTVTAPETVYPLEEENILEITTAYEESIAATEANASNFDDLDELKSELDAEEEQTVNKDEDYETHYHLATAYKEMGLMENAIREFQDAINLVESNDGTRRFFQCANHLGHCFMEKQMPKAAAKWFMRDLEVEDLTDKEKQAIFYDLADALEADGEMEKAAAYFEQLYAENIGYRDVSGRLEKLQQVVLQV